MVENDEDHLQVICFCHNVNRGELVKAIHEGCVTLRGIMKQTDAATGCGGCEVDVVEILDAQLKAHPQLKG